MVTSPHMDDLRQWYGSRDRHTVVSENKWMPVHCHVDAHALQVVHAMAPHLIMSPDSMVDDTNAWATAITPDCCCSSPYLSVQHHGHATPRLQALQRRQQRQRQLQRLNQRLNHTLKTQACRRRS